MIQHTFYMKFRALWAAFVPKPNLLVSEKKERQIPSFRAAFASFQFNGWSDACQPLQSNVSLWQSRRLKADKSPSSRGRGSSWFPKLSQEPLWRPYKESVCHWLSDRLFPHIYFIYYYFNHILCLIPFSTSSICCNWPSFLLLAQI